MTRDGAEKPKKPPPKNGKRRGLLEIEVITDKVEALILENRSVTWIARHLKMPQRTVEDYAARARKRWDARFSGDREELRKSRLARINQLSSKAERARSWSAVSSLERLISDIHGLRVVRHELSGKDGAPLTMPPEQAVDLIRKELDEMAARKKGEAETTPEPDKEPA